ncbi:hypothetical protein [Marixanthomonas spongiae]|nr:hypothetical protein [Marixanthomonas spongiae]
MKKILLLLIAIFAIALTSAQTASIEGEYGKRTETDVGSVLEYTLSLKPDGTFTFHFYRNIDATQPKEHLYGRGTWELVRKDILFHSDETTDMDEKYTLDFSDTKARFIKKPSKNRNATEKVAYFLFYDSQLPMIKGLKLLAK